MVEHQERSGDDEYSFLLVFKRLQGTKRLRSYQAPKPGKTALVVRYGAFGDLMPLTNQ